MARNIRRILVYTHNSIGMGHAFRTLAVITGIRRHRPDIDFLVLSGSSIPCLFLDHGIDVVKLPSIKKEVDEPGAPLRPRYLTSLGAQEVYEYRQRVILETFEFFSPDVVMIEHYMGGLMNEALPLIRKRRAGGRNSREWLLVHLSRGICPTFAFDRKGAALAADQPSREAIDTAGRFDLIYVFEDPAKVDSNSTLLKHAPDLQNRIHYLGPIAVKTLKELPARREVLKRMGLADRPIILLSLGRHGPVLQMATVILTELRRFCLERDYQVVMPLDPYLDRAVAHALQEQMVHDGVRVLPFTPFLIDLVNISEFAICRAGYNAVNEVLMTGISSMVIPERHPGSEQECRAGSIQRENVLVAEESQILNGALPSLLNDLLSRKRRPGANLFDKYAIGRRMLHDFENLCRPSDSEGEPRKEDALSYGRDIS